jgi:HEAT repeat protein
VAALIEVSRDPRENVRRAVLKALGEIDAADVKGLLRSALSDVSKSDTSVRFRLG